MIPWIQTAVDWLLVIMGSLLVLFTAGLLLLHLMTGVRNRAIAAMKERLLELLNENLRTERMRRQLASLVDPAGEVQRLREIRGIRTRRGMLVIETLMPDMNKTYLAELRKAVLDPWYLGFLKKRINSRSMDDVILTMKLAGDLGLNEFTGAILRQTYLLGDNAAAQQIGLLSLCLLGEAEAVVTICTDPAFVLKVSFRTLLETFQSFAGDRKRLYERLIDDASDAYVRRVCIKRIGTEQLECLAPRVMPYLENASMNLQIDAIRTLGQLRFAQAGQRILTLADDARWEVRAAVVTALSEIDAERYFDAISGGLFDREWWVRSRSAEQLARRTDADELLARVGASGDRYAFEMLRFEIGRARLWKGASL